MSLSLGPKSILLVGGIAYASMHSRNEEHMLPKIYFH